MSAVQMEGLSDAGGFVLARYAGVSVAGRDRLVSMMLQDRGVLRLISAPHGFGKSLLAYEYARRMFGQGQVLWIDGASPEFIQALDKGFLVPLGMGEAEAGGLVIIDDLPALDEKRMETCSLNIDRLLYQGTEVVVTTLPSCDFLRGLQPDRVLIAAGDLLVTERDVRTSVLDRSDAERHGALERWNMAAETFFGRAACSVWGAGPDKELECLTGFFEERLPMEFFKAAFAMLLMGSGSFADLERLGTSLRQETEQMMAKDYVFLGIDPVQREFSIGKLDLGCLERAVERSGRSDALLRGVAPLHEKVLGLLLEKGDAARAGAIMDALCSDEHCASWLRDCGWELLDRGEIRLAEELFKRCREEELESDCSIMAMRSWACGLVGDQRESAYYARRVMSSAQGEGGGESPSSSQLMAYLSMLAFSQGSPTVCSKRLFAPAVLQSPADFLAAVVDLCEEEELVRSFGVLEGNLVPTSMARSKEGAVAPSPEREEAMVTLLTGCFERFQGSPAFRLALHMLACVESSRIREAVQEVGCGLLISMRRNGVACFTQSVLISDLWRGGFFGVNSRSADVRDAKLMNVAGAFLSKLTMLSGKEAAAIPWDAGSPLLPVSSMPKGARVKGGASALGGTERVPVVNVRLFGGLEVVVGERFVPEERWSHRALQLFTILVLYQGRDVSRETIFAQLWPTLTRKRALDNFYNAWSRIQALLGEGPYIARRGEFCCVNSRFVCSDVAEFDQLARRLLTERDNASTILDVYARMEHLYRGGLMPSEVGNEFIDAQRARYRATYVDSMITASQRSLELKDTRLALWFARNAMDEDQKREDVFAALIRAQIAAGQRCSAIRTYFQCVAFLRDELGLDPCMEVQSLYDQLIVSDPSLLKLGPDTFSI